MSKDDEQIGEVVGIRERHERFQRIEGQDMRVGRCVESQGHAVRIENQVGKEQLGFAGQEQLKMPGIPKVDPNIIDSGRQPEGLRIQHIAESGPGHHDDD